MARSTFKVLFYLKRQSEKDGMAPIMGRITVNGTIAQFSCKLSVAPRLWDVKANKAAGKSTVAQRINEKLDKIRALIIKQYDKIAVTDNFVSAEKVKNAYLDFGDEYRTLLSVTKEFLDEYGKRVGKDRTPGSYEQQCINHKRIFWFLRDKYSLSDIPLREIEPSFIEDFHYYLTVTRSLASGTVIGAITKLKQLILYSIRKRYISYNPFMGFRCMAQYRDRGFLTEEELQTFMHAELRRYKQRQVRDIFVFCCFTGLSYSDVKKLTFDHIKTSFDGDSWIIAHRQKTGTPSHIEKQPRLSRAVGLRQHEPHTATYRTGLRVEKAYHDALLAPYVRNDQRAGARHPHRSGQPMRVSGRSSAVIRRSFGGSIRKVRREDHVRSSVSRMRLRALVICASTVLTEIRI